MKKLISSPSFFILGIYLNRLIIFYVCNIRRKNIVKQKIIGIFVCMLLIAVTILPVAGTINPDIRSESNIDSEISPLGEVKDQYQEDCYECRYFDNYAWQQFVPTKSKLLRVEVSIAQWYYGSPDITLSIERPLGNVLTSKSLPVSAIPEYDCDWVSFDVPNVMLTPGNTYYIVLSYPFGGEYSWCGTWGNPYPKGESDIHPDWDWCFRTWVSHGEIKPVPMLEFKDIKGGLPGISVVLENTGNVTAFDIEWSIKITEGSFLSMNMTLFLPIITKGKIDELGPHQGEKINIPLMFGLGRATVTFNCKYTIETNSIRGEIDAEGKQEWRDQSAVVLHTFPPEEQPTREWKPIESYTYIGSDQVLLKYQDILSKHNVRVHSVLSKPKFTSTCSFTDGTGILTEGHITEDIVTSGDAYWEVEILTYPST